LIVAALVVASVVLGVLLEWNKPQPASPPAPPSLPPGVVASVSSTATLGGLNSSDFNSALVTAAFVNATATQLAVDPSALVITSLHDTALLPLPSTRKQLQLVQALTVSFSVWATTSSGLNAAVTAATALGSRAGVTAYLAALQVAFNASGLAAPCEVRVSVAPTVLQIAAAMLSPPQPPSPNTAPPEPLNSSPPPSATDQSSPPPFVAAPSPPFVAAPVVSLTTSTDVPPPPSTAPASAPAQSGR